jgi:AraC-like DNA-binding protein
VSRILENSPVLGFKSIEEFDHWRLQHSREEPIGADIRAALAELGCSTDQLPRKLRAVLESAGTRPRVPTLEDLSRHWPSRRSFYRRWTEEIRVAPNRFLRRVRALHAIRLMREGCSAKEAAHASGFTSVAQMRRELRRDDASLT